MSVETDLEPNNVIGPDQKDRETFTGNFTSSFLAKLNKITANHWLWAGTSIGVSGAIFAIPEIVLAQQVNPDQFAQKPQVYSDAGIDQDYYRITHPATLSNSDQIAKKKLLSQINNRSGTIFENDEFRIEYIQSTDQVMIDLYQNPNEAKIDGEQWLTDFGLSPEGICNLPTVFNVDGPNARQQLIDSGQQFNPTPIGCTASNINSNTLDGNTPDTDPVYLKQAQDARNQAEPPDPFQMVAQMILKLPYQESDFSLDYDIETNTFTETLKKGQEAKGTVELDQFLQQNNVDKAYLRHLKVSVQ